MASAEEAGSTRSVPAQEVRLGLKALNIQVTMQEARKMSVAAAAEEGSTSGSPAEAAWAAMSPPGSSALQTA